MKSQQKFFPRSIVFDLFKELVTIKSARFLAFKRRSGLTSLISSNSIITRLLSQIDDDSVRALLYEKFITGDIDEKHIKKNAAHIDQAVVTELVNLMQKRSASAPSAIPSGAIVYAVSGRSFLQFKILPQSLRSIRQVADQPSALFIGAKTELYYLQGGVVTSTFKATVPPKADIKGGFNSCLLHKNRVYATHSELGVQMWPFTEGTVESSTPLFKEIVSNARTVRSVMSVGDEILFSAGPIVYQFNSETLKINDSYSQSHGNITQIMVVGDFIIAGTEEGYIVKWQKGTDKQPFDILKTDGVVSRLSASDILGIPHIFYSGGRNWIRARWPDVTTDTVFELNPSVKIKNFAVCGKLLVAGCYNVPEVYLWNVDFPSKSIRVSFQEFDTAGIVDIVCFLKQ